jgi:hypothetical protein
MEYVYDIKQKGIMKYPLDIRKDRKDVLFVKYLLIGPIILIVPVVTTS